MLATQTDVEAALGRDLATSEEGRAAQLLATASEAVSAETNRYRFEPGTYTVRRKVHSGRVKIPAKVDSVASVASVDPDTGAPTPLTGWNLYGSTVYGIQACTAEIQFTVTEAVPAAVVAIVAGAVSATLSGPQQGASSETVGPWSVSYVDGSGRVWFSKSDKAILAKYRQPKHAVTLL